MNGPWAYVFDLGNVLIFVHLERFYEKLAAGCEVGVGAERIFLETFDRIDVGRGGDFEEVYPVLVREAKLGLTRDEFRLAWNDIFTRNAAMVELVRTLPRPRVLLSNTSAPHVAWIKQQFPEVLPLFDSLVLSNEVGLLKPDPAIYRYVESLTGLPSARHLFADDLPENVEGARACGWEGHEFRDRAGYVRWVGERVQGSGVRGQ